MEPTRHPIAFSCHRHTRTTERNRSMKQKSKPCSHLNPTTSIYARLWELLWLVCTSQQSSWCVGCGRRPDLNLLGFILYIVKTSSTFAVFSKTSVSCAQMKVLQAFQPWWHSVLAAGKAHSPRCNGYIIDELRSCLLIAAQIWKLDLKHKLPAILLVLDVHKNLGFPIGYEAAWGVSCGWIPSSIQDVSWCQWPPVGRPTPKAWHPDGIFVHVTTLEVPEQRRNHLTTHWYYRYL